MKNFRIFPFVLIFCTLFGMMGTLLYFREDKLNPSAQDPYSAGLLAQNTYLGPIRPPPGNPYLVRVQVLVHDSPELGGVEIQSVEFDRQSIPLKPRDIFGNRGQASFQLAPGKYLLRWVARRDKILWPRTVTREEEVLISPKDLWIQISIEGENVSIR